MGYDTWVNFKKSQKVIDRLKSFYNIGKSNGTYALTLNNVNEMFAENNWPAIEIIKHQTHIEKDCKPTFIKPFASGAVSFAPAGFVGTLHHSISMEELHRVDNKSYAKFGPTLVSKWAENDPLTEFTAMEMNAFPGLDIDSIYILDTLTVKASFD
jgi:hypothetical protein